jgi:hypothetical protein
LGSLGGRGERQGGSCAREPAGYVAAMAMPRTSVTGMRLLDEEGHTVELDADEAASILALTDRFDDATVSACPTCASRILAVVAVADIVEAAPPHPRALEILELAEDAPTLHVYLVDETVVCAHTGWRDPGFEEWVEVVGEKRVIPGRR